jgi:excisionase family DNA binding protein
MKQEGTAHVTPPVTAQVETPWLTTAQAALYIHRHEEYIRELLRAGAIHGSQTGPNGRWLIHRDALDAYVRGEVAPVEVPKVTRKRAS